jgi:hypothetical protein
MQIEGLLRSYKGLKPNGCKPDLGKGRILLRSYKGLKHPIACPWGLLMPLPV